MSNKKKLTTWLIDQGLSAKAYNSNEMVSSFLSEMELGLFEKQSSLAMLPTYISPKKNENDTKIAFIDAGGTNLRTGLAFLKSDGSISLDLVKKREMPGRNSQISSNEFYDNIALSLNPFSHSFTKIGFCFSYPTEILPNKDGRLLHWTKEIKIPDMEGKCIGLNLAERLKFNGLGEKSITLLNDTTATLLAGCSASKFTDDDLFIGFILGTGVNCAFTYNNEIINMESGNFSKWNYSKFDNILDSCQMEQGSYRFEKAISGAYLGSLALVALKEILTLNLFSHDGSKIIDTWDSIDTEQLSMYLAGTDKNNWNLSKYDGELLKEVFKSIVDRAAFFSAINIASAIIYNKPDNKKNIVNFDGSTLHRTPHLATKTKEYLSSILKTYDYKFKVITVSDSPAIGAALAAIS